MEYIETSLTEVQSIMLKIENVEGMIGVRRENFNTRGYAKERGEPGRDRAFWA